jgi:hypothetical protein
MNNVKKGDKAVAKGVKHNNASAIKKPVRDDAGV